MRLLQTVMRLFREYTKELNIFTVLTDRVCTLGRQPCTPNAEMRRSACMHAQATLTAAFPTRISVDMCVCCAADLVVVVWQRSRRSHQEVCTVVDASQRGHTEVAHAKIYT